MQANKLTIGIFLIVVGIALFMAGWGQWQREKNYSLARSFWPITSGTVSDSKLSGEFLADFNLDMSVDFSYQVGDRHYTGTQTWFVIEKRFDGIPREALAARQKFSPGALTAVYYNPADPSEAAVEPGASDRGWQFVLRGSSFILGTIFLIAGLIACGYFVLQKKL